MDVVNNHGGGGAPKLCHVRIEPLEMYREDLQEYWYCDNTGLVHIEVPSTQWIYYEADIDVVPGIMVLKPNYKGGISVAEGDAEVVTGYGDSGGLLQAVYVYGDCTLRH